MLRTQQLLVELLELLHSYLPYSVRIVWLDGCPARLAGEKTYPK